MLLPVWAFSLTMSEDMDDCDICESLSARIFCAGPPLSFCVDLPSGLSCEKVQLELQASSEQVRCESQHLSSHLGLAFLIVPLA